MDAVQLAADGRDIAHLMFTVVDEKGVRVPDAELEVTINVTGPLKILGIDNGRTTDAVDYQDNRSEAYRGRGMVFLQAVRQSGSARITASAEGLQPAESTIHVK
jgi:beta-galactosidase